MRQKQLKDTYSNKKKKPARTGHKFEDQAKDSDFSESSLKRQGGNVQYDKNNVEQESEDFQTEQIMFIILEETDTEDRNDTESQEDQLQRDNQERGKKRKKSNEEEEEVSIVGYYFIKALHV